MLWERHRNLLRLTSLWADFLQGDKRSVCVNEEICFGVGCRCCWQLVEDALPQNPSGGSKCGEKHLREETWKSWRPLGKVWANKVDGVRSVKAASEERLRWRWYGGLKDRSGDGMTDRRKQWVERHRESEVEMITTPLTSPAPTSHAQLWEREDHIECSKETLNPPDQQQQQMSELNKVARKLHVFIYSFIHSSKVWSSIKLHIWMCFPSSHNVPSVFQSLYGHFKQHSSNF